MMVCKHYIYELVTLRHCPRYQPMAVTRNRTMSPTPSRPNCHHHHRDQTVTTTIETKMSPPPSRPKCHHHHRDQNVTTTIEIKMSPPPSRPKCHHHHRDQKSPLQPNVVHVKHFLQSFQIFLTFLRNDSLTRENCAEFLNLRTNTASR